ncbi:MAG TPA: sigma-54 dependent transcriptional regulator [Candidatus Hydrogenedentes bacterium]|jgi:DNA-binding NtrC family response regulator|nr:MAG: Transcriptional regulatory protein ZraR [Candidatus Hydrogenedentes bacterium ADurb.Bin170]HNZ49762.1 sigma-54 dependent transcriptional regulator [Candidatus Hydrogenedentota bacterium]HOD95598.1 sigma-54 dependent transcriptional regulator [Candidatus Hydrogenedentota bacterium]HOH42022.1 sigma-54 dependent transcriptional regulator [Candidatus Hydrogenedentota bacterium]HOM49202.1 sigma-54 dependent transcriptional regulator [Candidatus Hydrogenedentota bacterium]
MNDRKHILVVDDDPGQRDLLRTFLEKKGSDVTTAASGDEALALLQQGSFSLLISDIRMPGMSGLSLLEALRQICPLLPVLMVTAYPDVRDAVEAMRGGAVDYLEKPIDLEELLSTVSRILGWNADKTAPPAPLPPLPEGIAAQSPALHKVLHEIALVAPSDARVLITGESGSGKEIIADLLHAWSDRKAAPMIKVNCAALPENLLESELFGHEKGAFTSAVARRTGRFEEADGGTLFLDEIGEISPSVQAKLLRVIQDGSYSRVGSNVELKSNARILAATNRDLENEVVAGRFREDLYYRLNVIEIHMPPLRHHKQDIPLLAARFARELSRGNVRFSAGAMAALETWHWPGNVRELRNAIERAVLLSGGSVILPEHLPRQLIRNAENETGDAPAATLMENVERTAILQALRENNYVRTETARALGISRRTLNYRLRQYKDEGYQIDPES